MPSDQAAAARATAAVLVNDRRTGSAVLVTSRYLVTAAHVLAGRDPETGARIWVNQVELEFPAAAPGAPNNRLMASRLDLGEFGVGADVAVLDLGNDPRDGRLKPIPVWPTARPPEHVRVFGYPLTEGPLNGVWRQFDVGGPTASGSVQLDWAADVGTFPGHSGGPVLDAGEGALAGILVEGAVRGRFDRYLPISTIAKVWLQMPRPWLMTGAGRSEARSHFTRRSRGQRNKARGGDLFRGRRIALDRVGGWLTADEPPGLPLVVTGQPGAGKSAVLARAALNLEAGSGGPGLAFHARAATIGDFLDALASLVGADTPPTADELIDTLDVLPIESPIPVAVDALDEAASEQDRWQIAEALTELAALPVLRVAVATRPMATGNPRDLGGLLPALSVTSSDAPSLVDLDEDAYFDPADVLQFVAALLAQEGANRPGPPGAAWSVYRNSPVIRDRLAGVVCDRAGRNFLVAAMAAVPLSTAGEIVDSAAEQFDPSSIPSRVGEALSKYLGALPEQRRERERALLTALAYARGTGLNDSSWLAFAAALGYQATVADLDVLRRSAAADYLLQTITAERGARPLTRLFHQALTDELLADRHQPSDESALLDIVFEMARRSSWEDPYARSHAAEHASSAGRIDELLDDALYLTTVDPEWLVPHLDPAQSTDARAMAVVYRQTAHLLATLDQPMRVSQLELTAHRLGYRSLAARITADFSDRPWQTLWSHSSQVIEHQILIGNKGSVHSLAVGALPDRTPVVVSGGDDGTVRAWRLADGTPTAKPMHGHDGGVFTVASGVLKDGTPVIASGGLDGSVRVWRLADGAPIGDPLLGHDGGVYTVALGELPDGTQVVVSGGEDGLIRQWRLADGTPVGEPLRGHNGAVNAVAVGMLPDETPVLVSGGDDGTIRVWRLADGTPLGHPLPGPEDSVQAIALGVLPNGTQVVVSGGHDGPVRVWRLADGTPVGEPLRGPDFGVSTVAIGALTDDAAVLVSSGYDGLVRVWRLADSTPAGDQLPGADSEVNAVALGVLADGTQAIFSGGADGLVRMWRLDDGSPVGEPLNCRGGGITAVALAVLPDSTPVVVSGSADGSARMWRLDDGCPIGEPLRDHDAEVRVIAVGALKDGTPVAVSGRGWDRKSIWVWRLTDGTQVGELLQDLAAPVPVVLEGGIPAQIDTMITAAAVRTLPDGTPVLICGSSEFDGSVQVWRLADGTPVGERMGDHSAGVTAVAEGALADGTSVVVSGGDDEMLRVWLLGSGTSLVPPLNLSQMVRGVAIQGNVIVSAAGPRIAVHQFLPPVPAD